MINNRAMAERKLASLQFTMWELHLYLDTHPFDKTAKMRLNVYSKNYMQMKAQYENQFGPLTAMSGHGEDWLKSPWPWDNKEECAK